MIEAFELDLFRANVYALLWAILGVSTGSLLLQVGVAEAATVRLIGLMFIISMGFILWGMVWDLLFEPYYVDTEAGETA